MHTDRDLIVFTDLDGTLLDYHTYSKDAALPALGMLHDGDIPLIVASSKTRAEIEPMLDLPQMSRAFITENGSAVFFRKDLALGAGENTEPAGDYMAVVLGERYGIIVAVLHKIGKECGIRLRGFSDMTASEVARATGLDLQSASRAKQREFSEPFEFTGDPSQLKTLIEAIERHGLSCVQGGKFHHVLGRCDKGRAARKVVDVYGRTHPGTARKIVALGDSENDTPLLKVADIAVVIRRHDGTFMDYAPQENQEVIRPAGIGPVGWNEAMLDLLHRNPGSG